jgi:thiamine-phosphate pyrophosphorylase
VIEPTGKPVVYLISEGSLTDDNYQQHSDVLVEVISKAVDIRIPLVQIREKNLSARNLFHLACRAAEAADDSATKILINERADIALAAGCAGVHLTATSVRASILRRSFPSDFVMGVSTHSLGEAHQASNDGADFAVFGPVFATSGKDRPVGLERLREVANSLAPFPVLAIGGIDSENIDQVLESGAAGFAAIRLLNDPANLERLARRFDL